MTDAITADRAALRLVVSVPAQHHEILATFEDARDFSLSICMLRKSGFAIRDQPGPRQFSSPPREQLAHDQPAISLGPRLSSVTPIPGLNMDHGPEHRNRWAFTSLLSSNNLSPFPSQPPLAAEPTRRHVQKPDAFASPLVNDAPHFPKRGVASDEASQLLNPYNLFLSKYGGDLHRPRVSSPLRNSFSPDGHVIPGSGPPACPAPMAGHPLILGSQSPSEWRAHEDFCEPGTRPSPQSRDKPTDLTQAGTPPTMFEEEQGQTSKAVSSFRNHMPQRRHLPFAQIKAPAPRRSSSAGSNNPRGTNRHRAVPPQDFGYQPELGKEHKDHRDESRRTTSSPCVYGEPPCVYGEPPSQSARSTDQDSSNHDEVLATDPSLSCSEQAVSWRLPQPDVVAQPDVVVADPLVIRQLNSTTSGLLEQYKADVSRGCDEGVCAQFYMERMQSCRREFWLCQLMDARRQGMAGLVSHAWL